METQEKPVINGTVLERHVQTILVSLVAAGIGYVVSEQNSTAKAAEGTKAQISFLIQQVGELRNDMRKLEGNYVRSDQYLDHEARLRLLENNRAK